MSIKSKLNIEAIRKACSKPMSERKRKLQEARDQSLKNYWNAVFNSFSKLAIESNKEIPINRARRLKKYGKE